MLIKTKQCYLHWTFVPSNLIDLVRLVVVPGDDDGSEEDLLYLLVEVGSSAASLQDLLDLVVDCVGSQNLATYFATQQDLIFVLPKIEIII